MLLDAHYYDGWARQVAVGNFGDSVFYGLPLYPFVLGMIYKFSAGSFEVAKWVQMTLGVVTVGLIYKIGLKLFDRRVALVAASLGAIYGPLFFNEAILIPESIGVPLYALAFLWAIDLFDAPDAGRAMKLGMVCALAGLTKAGILLFAFSFAVYLLWKKKPFKIVAIFLLALFVTLLPVTLHNIVRGKDMVFLTSHSGFNFYVGNNPKAEGTFDTPPGVGSNVESQHMDSKLIAEKEMGRALKPSEVSRYWSDKAWDFIRSNPGKVAQLCGRKLILFFDSRELSDVDDYVFGQNFNAFLRWPWPNFGVLVILLFAGLVPAFASPKRDLIFLWITAYLAGMLAFFVNARYRLPMLSVFIALAGASLVGLYDAFKSSRWKTIALFFGLALAGYAISHAHLVGTDPSRNFVNAGDARALQKDFMAAQSLYEEALKVNPDNPKAQLATGLNLARLGKPDESRPYYLKTLELDPENYQAHNNLGLWYEERGESEEALQHFKQALMANPNSFQAHTNLGMLYGKRGDRALAASEFEESIRLNPSGARAYMNLGLIRYQQGDRVQAKSLWEKALSLDPNFEDAKRALGLLSQAVPS
jgi:tetratricopeptide (TPR) repeat protein